MSLLNNMKKITQAWPGLFKQGLKAPLKIILLYHHDVALVLKMLIYLNINFAF